MLFLNKHDERFWTPRELKEELNLELTEEEITNGWSCWLSPM
ncbi:MAG: hypothetical protein R3E79_56210 [Caldilineaceae bacterium]